jgi:hypothetical protein
MEATSPAGQPPVTRARFTTICPHAQTTTTRSIAVLSSAQDSNTTASMRSRAALSGRVRSQSQHSRSLSRVASQSDETRNGPNTRSRKRRTPEQQQSAAQSAARKRARANQPSLKNPPPETGADDEDKKPAPADNCCICMCEVESDDLAGINGCEHRFCFSCIEKWAERENSCPLCKNRFSKIDRVNKKRKKGMKNTKKVKQRDQRSDLVPGAALQGLLGRLIEESRYRVPGRANDLTEFFSPPANFASRHPNPSITRLIFSGVGVGNFDFNSLHGPPSARFTRSTSLSAGLQDDSQFDSEEEESPLSNFIRAFQGHGVMQVVRPLTVTTHLASRSYASNINDRNAGNGAENPLEIDDDSDDDTVEVVGVRNPL